MDFSKTKTRSLRFFDHLFSYGMPESIGKFILYLDWFFNLEQIDVVICSIVSNGSVRILNDRGRKGDLIQGPLQEGQVTLNGNIANVFYLGENKGQDYYYILFDDDYSDIHYYIKSMFVESKKFENKLLSSINLIYKDDLTGLFNQRKLNLDIQEAISNCYNNPDSFVVMFIDIDFFKRVNDGHGHLVGTELLKQVARRMQSTIRDEDLIYRYGGDEFIILLRSINIDKAFEIGERILSVIRSTPYSVTIVGKKVEFSISVSIGMAEYPTHTKNYEEIINLADRMMYQAKTSGRGQVCRPESFV